MNSQETIKRRYPAFQSMLSNDNMANVTCKD